MKLNSKGQVTIPAPLREKYGLHEGDEIEIVEDGNTLRIVRKPGSVSKGARMVRRMRGSGTAEATSGMSTDDLMELLRG